MTSSLIFRVNFATPLPLTRHPREIEKMRRLYEVPNSLANEIYDALRQVAGYPGEGE